MLEVDVNLWLNLDAATSPDRLFCLTLGSTLIRLIIDHLRGQRNPKSLWQ
nr:hypothetical protein [Frankia sp. ACN1ag]